jgi:hypothetical protein
MPILETKIKSRSPFSSGERNDAGVKYKMETGRRLNYVMNIGLKRKPSKHESPMIFVLQLMILRRRVEKT